ncbi:MAG: hypothetical protein PHV37_08380 [Candidatus Gastranaerophilales bacterium]|nr:hypothetical protein [Candidatus Gastranaerophilales bacterium]
MKTKLLKKDGEYCVILPDEFIKTLHLKENELLKVDLDLALEKIELFKSAPDDRMETLDVEADIDF